MKMIDYYILTKFSEIYIQLSSVHDPCIVKADVVLYTVGVDLIRPLPETESGNMYIKMVSCMSSWCTCILPLSASRSAWANQINPTVYSVPHNSRMCTKFGLNMCLRHRDVGYRTSLFLTSLILRAVEHTSNSIIPYWR